jgi:hypothetical protein
VQSRQRFGAPEQVDFGGGCKPVKSEKFGKDLIVTFDAAGNGLTDGNFAAKLIGKTAWGKLWFGYSRLPGVDYSPYVIKRERHQANPGAYGRQAFRAAEHDVH